MASSIERLRRAWRLWLAWDAWTRGRAELRAVCPCCVCRDLIREGK